MLSDAVKLFAKLFLVITTVVTVFLYLFAIILEPLLFYLTPEGLTSSAFHLSVLPLWFLNIPIRIPIDLNLGIVFFGLWSIFTLSFVAAWKIKENFHATIKHALTKPAQKLFSNSLFAMPVINSMTLIAVIVISSIQEVGGIPTGTSPITGEPFTDFFELSYSAVVEEVGFRLLPIGFFIFLSLILVAKKKELNFSLAQKIKLFFAAILFPEKAKTMAKTKTVTIHGVRNGISTGEWGMLLFTSLVFGLAHFNPGVSWDVGKISSATIAGLIIGFSYLVYGAHTAIIAHWFFNSYTDTYILLSEVYPFTEPLANVVAVLSLILGILGWGYVAYVGWRKLATKTQKNQQNSQIEATPSQPIFP